MSLVSMTGHGSGQASSHGVLVDVELSSVNRKQFDLRLSLPRSLSALESRIHPLIHSYVQRGCVSAVFRISQVSTGQDVAAVINESRALEYVKELRKLAASAGIAPDISLDRLVLLPGVLEEPATALENLDSVWPAMERAIKRAATELVAMRKVEGEALAADLVSRFGVLRRKHAQIVKVAPTVARQHKRAMLKRLKDIEMELPADDPLLLREVAVYADRSDVSEEIVRLASHFDQGDGLMKKRQPVGRAFDFLCQEILREINTIGSKANDGRLAKLVIEFKSELERAREQVQNVE
jgi:uncharacterized protein (TIGR00255 family)